MTLLRIDPAIHSAWTSPTTLRFGIDRAVVVLDNPPPKIERLIGALRDGVPRARYPHIAAAFGVNAADREQLLDALQPVLLRMGDAVPTETGSLRIHLDEDPDVRTQLGALASAAGYCLASADDAQFVLLTTQFSCTPARSRQWMTRGKPHLPIVFGESRVSIGPLVGVSNNPCAFCLELTRVDTDPDWPAIASQCIGKRANTNEPSLASITAGVVVELLRRWTLGEDALLNTRISIRAHPEQLIAVSYESVMPHPRCDCQTFVA
jgi:hypothetical protein